MEPTERILRDYRRVAVVGFSRDPSKAAHAIPLQLIRAGFEVVPVNPQLALIAGLTSYPRLSDVPGPLELVLVFRPSAEAGAIAEQAVAAGARAVWLQQGITSAEARAVAERAGLGYVEDACIGVERAIHRITKS